jgi:hypothetical protein
MAGHEEKVGVALEANWVRGCSSVNEDQGYVIYKIRELSTGVKADFLSPVGYFPFQTS